MNTIEKPEAMAELLKYIKDTKELSLREIARRVGLAPNTIIKFFRNHRAIKNPSLALVNDYLSNNYIDYDKLDKELKSRIIRSNLEYLIRPKKMKRITGDQAKFDYMGESILGDYIILRPSRGGSAIVANHLSITRKENKNIGSFSIRAYEEASADTDFSGTIYLKSGYFYLVSDIDKKIASNQITLRRSTYDERNLLGISLLHTSEGFPIATKVYVLRKEALINYETIRNVYNKENTIEFNETFKPYTYEMLEFLIANNFKKEIHETDINPFARKMVLPKTKPIMIRENISDIERILADEKPDD